MLRNPFNRKILHTLVDPSCEFDLDEGEDDAARVLENFGIDEVDALDVLDDIGEVVADTPLACEPETLIWTWGDLFPKRLF